MVFSHGYFVKIRGPWGRFGIFTFYFLFLIEKLLACVLHAPASGWRPRHSGGACDATRCPNLVIHRLLGCAVILSSTWCGACGRIIVGLPPVIDCLCFFFLFSLLTTKMHNCPLCLLFFNLSSHYLNFLFHPYFFYRSFFLILSFNYNFLYVLFFILFLILLIFYFVFIPF